MLSLKKLQRACEAASADIRREPAPAAQTRPGQNPAP